MNHSHHVVPLRYYLGTGASLLVLTIITVWVSRIDLGFLNVPVALAIAVVKASLVVTFFMGLRWDRGFNVMILLCTVLFILIFLFLTLTDTMARGQIDKRNEGVHNLQKRVSPPSNSEEPH